MLGENRNLRISRVYTARWEEGAEKVRDKLRGTQGSNNQDRTAYRTWGLWDEKPWKGYSSRAVTLFSCSFRKSIPTKAHMIGRSIIRTAQLEMKSLNAMEG